jgi:hypothetical protein
MHFPEKGTVRLIPIDYLRRLASRSLCRSPSISQRISSSSSISFSLSVASGSSYLLLDVSGDLRRIMEASTHNQATDSS